jgi:hypothetical protein
LLREWQGLTYREISAELGLSQAAVETLIFRARRALAQGLEQDADTWKKRLRRGADVGGAIAFVKALLGGGGAAAVKIAATAIAVAATTVAAATEVPKHAQHAAVIKPTPAVTRHVTATIASPATTSAGSLSHVTSTRSLPKPVALPASHPEQTAVVSATTQPSSAPETPPAPAPSRPDPTLPPAATATSVPSAPAGNGNGNGKGNKDERTIQATTQTTETTSVPPVVDPPAQQSDQGQGNDNKVKPDKPANGNADASSSGNGNGNNGKGKNDK